MLSILEGKACSNATEAADHGTESVECWCSIWVPLCSLFIYSGTSALGELALATFREGPRLTLWKSLPDRSRSESPR